jgi:Na+/melibiose symporter-like transporter
MSEQRWSNAVLAAYAGPALPLAALVTPAYIYLPNFYAQEMGLGLAAVGFVLLIARLWDVVTDLLVGAGSDATESRWGARRPWVVAGAPLVLLSTWQLLVPAGQVGLTHLWIWSLALYLGWTMVMLPLAAWGAELSADYDERSRITAWREGFTVAGSLIALAIAAVSAGTGGDGQPESGERAALQGMAWFVLILLPIALVLLLTVTPEPARLRAAKIGLGEGLRIIAGNRPFLRLLAAYAVNSLANGLPATLFLFFVQFVLEAPQASGWLLLVYGLFGIASVPLWLKLSYRYGKHRVWCAAMIAACAFFACAPLLGPGDVAWFVAICVATGICVGADLTLPASMQADVIDIDTAQSGQQRTGIYFAFWGMATKLSLALAVGLAFPALQALGFSAETGGNLFALAAFYALVPVALKLLAIAIMWNHPVDRALQEELRATIAARWKTANR